MNLPDLKKKVKMLSFSCFFQNKQTLKTRRGADKVRQPHGTNNAYVCQILTTGSG